ncbi:DAK2 domain-containing protein [Levilinea saccharolytica]|uniref:DAK2 domain-containing protein n=1 Tax=Levilinea saccharolytica TaxID=229921 RepID=UPI0007839BF0|nr:DAK2 domain-containing protein [Levilinea saccharolytica]GAP16535.1 predicted kinase related to dihydroxyacetone kinase [Levilinea saccharolytica]
MTNSGVDLVSLFQTVTQTLAQNQQGLNQADVYNQDHGTNMVQTFQTITEALQEKSGSADSTAMAYAAKKLEASTRSSSGHLYAQGLNQAAAQFKGKKVDAQGAMQLLQTLIAGGQVAPKPQTPAPAPQPQAPAAGGDDMLGQLLGGLMGGQTAQAPQPQAPAAGGDELLGQLLGGLMGGQTAQAPQPQAPAAGGADMLGALLGGLTGSSGTQSNAQDGLDMGDLLNAGMAYMAAKQQGGSNAQALLQAFLAGSGMGTAPHRQQSTQLVIGSFLQALSGMAK